MALNTVERIRIKLGFTKPQMLRVMGLSPEHNSLFSMPEDRLASVYVDRAKSLEKTYELWRDRLLRAVDEAEATHGAVRLLTAFEACQFLNISEFHLSQLRARGEVGAVEVKPRAYRYTYSDVRNLIKSNSRVISPSTRKQRGPLANAFLNSLTLAQTA